MINPNLTKEINGITVFEHTDNDAHVKTILRNPFKPYHPISFRDNVLTLYNEEDKKFYTQDGKPKIKDKGNEIDYNFRIFSTSTGGDILFELPFVSLTEFDSYTLKPFKLIIDLFKTELERIEKEYFNIKESEFKELSASLKKDGYINYDIIDDKSILGFLEKKLYPKKILKINPKGIVTAKPQEKVTAGEICITYDRTVHIPEKVIIDFFFEYIAKRNNDYQELLSKSGLVTQSNSSKKTSKKFIANEHALAYIFDLYAEGKQVPINRTEGGLNAKEIKRIGIEKGFDKPDTFYRAVKNVLKFDLNKTKDLNNISKDWFNGVKTLSNNWVKTSEYLKEKGLSGD
ncbi:hypothetical protein R9C00_17990 [Flammeovirgaceae bacterium SG7u.111]|nr:hypothetical protein [Flammeovirgaceae bacterium SG7u.132]WPO33596.1 hypothetical protein R9C00_17990 [Flammeovirgaceae bacterium SG7u.111]